VSGRLLHCRDRIFLARLQLDDRDHRAIEWVGKTSTLRHQEFLILDLWRYERPPQFIWADDSSAAIAKDVLSCVRAFAADQSGVAVWTPCCWSVFVQFEPTNRY
jgi:hypothetical protein